MNNNLEVLSNTNVGESILIKYDEEFSKLSLYYGKIDNKYCFKDDNGLFEFTGKFLANNLELTKIDED